VTGRKIREIRDLMKQKVIDVVRDRRGVRFDVYFEDDENKKYDFEMQTGRFKDLPKRSRYYQSMIDSDSLNKNASYKMLPDSLICFICTKDPFKHGRMVCTIQNQIMEIGEEFGDGSKTIILYRLVSAMYRLVT